MGSSDTGGGSSTPTWPNLDAGFWQAVEGFLWVIAAVALVLAFRKELVSLVRALILRVKTGAALKIFNIEFGPIRVSAKPLPSDSSISAAPDATGQWRTRREGVYGENAMVFLAHRLFPSELQGQLYDVLIYLVPHRARGASLRGVERVEYYFGDSWGNSVFASSDSGNRFGIVVSSYGSGFLCVAKVFFRNREPVETWRFVDFEMGPLGEGGESMSAA